MTDSVDFVLSVPESVLLLPLKERKEEEERKELDQTGESDSALKVNNKLEEKESQREVIERAFRDIHLPSVLWFSPPLNVDEMDEEGRESEKQTRKGENSFSPRIGVEERLDLIFSFSPSSCPFFSLSSLLPLIFR